MVSRAGERPGASALEPVVPDRGPRVPSRMAMFGDVASFAEPVFIS